MKSDDFSKQKLAEYRQHLESGSLRDMRMYQKLPAFLDNPRMFSGYPNWRWAWRVTCSPLTAVRRN